MTKKTLFCLLLLLTILPPSLFSASLYQDTNRFAYGFQRVLGAAIQLPFRTIQRTLSGPIGVGTVAGVLDGTVRTVTDLMGGTFDMAAAAAPYAKYAVFI